MYGDTAVIKARVGQLREQADDVRAMADRLVAQAEVVDWRGRAADDLRGRMAGRAEHLRAVASRHDEAASGLDRHLAAIADLQDRIAEAERLGRARVEEASARVAEVASHLDEDAAAGVHRAADPDDQRLAALSLPPSGHRDWLDIDISGSRS